MPADTPSAATHHMTAAVTRTSHRMAPAMMLATTANGVTPAMTSTVSAAATHGVAAAVSSPMATATAATALFGVGEGRNRNGEKCGKRDARKAGHGWNLHGSPCAPSENAGRERLVPFR